MLLDHNDPVTAETELRRALVVVPTSDHDDYQIRARLMQLSIDRQDWTELEHLARAALNASPHRPEAHWAIIDAYVQNGRLQRAYQQLRQRPDLDVHDEYSTVRKIDLLNRFDPTVESAIEILELADRFRTSERVRGMALTATRTLNNVDNLPDHIAERAKRQWEDFFADFPDSDAFTAIDVGTDGDMDAMIAALRPLLEPRAQMLDDLANQCRTGLLPIGMFSHLARVPYAAVCLNGGPEGIVVAVTGNEWLTNREIDHAQANLIEPLVFDTTALATAVRTNNTWMLNRNAENVIATSTAIDIRKNETFTNDNSGTTLAWNLDTQRLQISETDPTQQAAEAERVRALISLTDSFTEQHLTRADIPKSLAELPDELVDEPWIAALALAHQRGVALVSDDHTLRALARHLGVAAFGNLRRGTCSPPGQPQERHSTDFRA